HQQAPPNDGNTSPPSLAGETFDSNSGTKSRSEAAYTAVGCGDKELHLDVAHPSSTATVFFDAPEAESFSVAPPTLDGRPVSREEGGQDAKTMPSIDVRGTQDIDDMEGAPLLSVGEPATYGSSDEHHEKGPHPIDVED